MNPILIQYEQAVKEFETRCSHLCRRVRGNPQEYYDSDASAVMKIILHTFISICESEVERVEKTKRPIDEHVYFEDKDGYILQVESYNAALDQVLQPYREAIIKLKEMR